MKCTQVPVASQPYTTHQLPELGDFGRSSKLMNTYLHPVLLLFIWLTLPLYTVAACDDELHNQVWRLDCIVEEGEEIPLIGSFRSRFLIVTKGNVYDLLYRKDNTPRTTVVRKTITARTYHDSQHAMLIIDEERGWKFGMTIRWKKLEDPEFTTSLINRGGSDFARVSKCTFHLASDQDSLDLLRKMAGHDNVSGNSDFGPVIEAFIERHTHSDEPCHEPKPPS